LDYCAHVVDGDRAIAVAAELFDAFGVPVSAHTSGCQQGAAITWCRVVDCPLWTIRIFGASIAGLEAILITDAGEA
jgi:hypothetical protein